MYLHAQSYVLIFNIDNNLRPIDLEWFFSVIIKYKRKKLFYMFFQDILSVLKYQDMILYFCYLKFLINYVITLFKINILVTILYFTNN